MSSLQRTIVGLGAVVLVGCGGGDVEGDVREAMREGSLGALVQAASGGDPEAIISAAKKEVGEILTEESRPLPYPRRLQDFLPSGPEGMAGYPVAELSCKRNDGMGISTAEGHYREEAIRWEGGIRLTIGYHGKDVFGQHKLGFGMLRPSGKKLQGFETAQLEGRDENSSSLVRLEVVERLLITAESDRASIETLRNAIGAIDLKGLKKAHADGSLFEPTLVDRMAEATLTRDAIEALIPRNLKTIACQGIHSRRERDSETPTTRADGTYPVGRMILTDFVTAERAAEEAPLDLRTHKTVELHKTQKSKIEHESFERGPLNVSVASIDYGGRKQIVLRAALGRFVVDFDGHWTELRPAAEGTHPALREQMEKMQKDNGIGVFASPEELIETVLSALDVEELQKLAKAEV